MPVNANKRHEAILRLIADKGVVTVSELCDLFQVSDMTIRRDLSALESTNLLRRIYGGAVSARGRSYEPPMLTRVQESEVVKRSIGAYAARFVNEGDSIALDVGTTTLEMARNLSGIRDITVVTSSLPIANVLMDYPNIRVILTGGIVRREEQSLIGGIAENTYQHYFVDKAFIGIGGVDLDVGLTEYNVEDAQIKGHMIRSSQQRILLADSAKFGRRKFVNVVPLSDIDTIVTDDSLDDEYQEALKQVVDLHVISIN